MGQKSGPVKEPAEQLVKERPFDGDPEGAGVARMATVGPQCGVRNDYG